MQIKAERGYLIPAINDEHTDYVACAEQLAQSIRHFHADAEITIMTRDMLPHGDQGGQANDWQVWYASPYRQTIKLEADMIAASAIDHWWTLFEHRDVVISQGARSFLDTRTTCRKYRKIFDDNNLPDVYNAITYWRISETAMQFFQLVRDIFQYWCSYKTLLKFPDESPSTDLVYAMAARIMGEQLVTMPDGVGPTVVHMKRGINRIATDDWTQELLWERDPVRINTVAQWGLVHYHVKDWRL